MQSIHGNFAIFRTRTVDGKNAIMLMQDPEDSPPLLYSRDDEEGSVEISFEDVQGGNLTPDSYLTLIYPGDFKMHFGPYQPKIQTV